MPDRATKLTTLLMDSFKLVLQNFVASLMPNLHIASSTAWISMAEMHFIGSEQWFHGLGSQRSTRVLGGCPIDQIEMLESSSIAHKTLRKLVGFLPVDIVKKLNDNLVLGRGRNGRILLQNDWIPSCNRICRTWNIGCGCSNTSIPQQNFFQGICSIQHG